MRKTNQNQQHHPPCTFVVETSGAISPKTLALLSHNGRLIRAETGEPKSD